MLFTTFLSLSLACTITISSAQNASEIKEQLALEGIPALIHGDSGYIAASQAYNLRYTVEPIAIAYPTTSEQISTVVITGADQKLNVVARSGGHSYIANGLGGTNGSLVVDLSQMKNITVDLETGNAIIEPGNRLGDVALALNDAGRGLPHGRCTYVGIGGHSGFGGWGFASRMWGMTLDNIISATVVLANGSIVTASEDLNSDLYWAIRGSSASFGIVSSLEFHTHPVPSSATAFEFTWEMDIPTASAAFSAFQSWALNGSSIPPEFGGEIGFLKGQAYGQVEFAFLGNYFGPDDKFNETIAPFFGTLPTPDYANVTQGTWIEALTAIAAGNMNTSTQPDSNDTFYAKSLMAPESVPLTNDSMTALVTYLAEVGYNSSDFWHVEVELYGGSQSVINQIGLNDTAFAHRDTLFTFQPYASSPNLLPPYPDSGFDFVDGMVDSLTSHMPDDWQWGAYPNYIEDRLPDWQTRYYGSHYDHLRVLKAEFDPTDMFRFPTSIEE
ncbi:glucooligosaccharide oxidase [Lentinula raphanica]|uniref:Glucooligosaccharide oxidase n=1 Tax=Lentinula raphanica TaxID=153919 RepID=A0AA38PBU1_9AGAR|nr:glucooligosaccharide oxidase [Lentinula raphanica]KAJ3840018.1 glucooligosaccharide oxidase [Lentinula raphanica]KAJ3975824.1 glucooligosaccharide oxidase [Lentinula raphanica]